VDTRNFKQVQAKWPDVRVYQDWREMLAKEGDKIDSVNVSTPDHMHGSMGLAAIGLGKHVYGQKPLAQNLWECRELVLRARAKGVMTQMGIQVSSGFTERLAVALIQMGKIGKVTEVHTFSNKKWGDLSLRPVKSDPIPAEPNWDQWLGVGSERSYINGYDHPGNWRRRRDFGTGTLGDMGCHMFSGWFRALGLAAPTAVVSRGPAPNKDNWAINAIVEYTFKGTPVHRGRHRQGHLDGRRCPPARRSHRADWRSRQVPGPRNALHRHRRGDARASRIHAHPVPARQVQGLQIPQTRTPRPSLRLHRLLPQG
jgi:predicted dehydrogenase